MPAALAFEPLRQDVLRDPYRLYAKMRETSPVAWDHPLQSWLLTRHRDCVAVLRDTGRFASDPRRAGEPVPDAALTVQMLDPPHHAALRARLNNACRAQDMAALRRRARGHADELLARLGANGEGEFMTEFAAPFALAVTCDFMGVDPPDLGTLAPIGEALMKGMDAGLRPEQAAPAAEARSKLSAIFQSWLDPPPKAGLYAALLAQNADKVLDAAIVNSSYVLFNSGYLSVSGAIGNAVLALLRCGQPVVDLLDPETIDLAVEELLRYDGYVQATTRVCVEEAEVGGERIAPGQDVILLLAAANRDPEQFTRPDDLLLDRTPNRHIQFGWGSHTCLGAFLAREMMKVTLLSLRDHAPDIQLAGEPAHKAQATVRCPDRIPVSVSR